MFIDHNSLYWIIAYCLFGPILQVILLDVPYKVGGWLVWVVKENVVFFKRTAGVVPFISKGIEQLNGSNQDRFMQNKSITLLRIALYN